MVTTGPRARRIQTQQREVHWGAGVDPACICPKAECGLVWGDHAVARCPYHGTSATIREFHYADSCPADPNNPTIRVSGA